MHCIQPTRWLKFLHHDDYLLNCEIFKNVYFEEHLRTAASELVKPLESISDSTSNEILLAPSMMEFSAKIVNTFHQYTTVMVVRNIRPTPQNEAGIAVVIAKNTE